MGAIGLDEVEYDAQGHHENDDGGIDPLAEDRGGGARDQQNDDQRIRQEQEDLDEAGRARRARDRKSTRLNSSHTVISYAVFCLKKKKKKQTRTRERSEQHEEGKKL